MFAVTGGIAAKPKPTEAPPTVEDWVYAYLAEEGSCSVEGQDNPMELCGGTLQDDFGLGIPPALALMLPRDTCSTLLEQLFAEQTCDMDDLDCQRVQRGLPAPPSVKLATSNGSAGQSALAHLDAVGPGGRRGPVNAQSDRLPRDRGAAPPVPPPRAFVA